MLHVCYLRLRNTCDVTCDVAVDAQLRPLFTCYLTNATDVGVVRLLPSGHSDLTYALPGYSSCTEGCSRS